MEEDIHKYNPIMPIFKTNLKTGEGVEELVKEILR
jgi:hydrogenase nickel incorporation protein HypB